MHRAYTLGAVLCGLLVSVPTQGQAPERPTAPVSDTTVAVPLTLDEARSLALRGNPNYLAVTQRLAVAEADVLTASTYPWNPELEMEGPGSFSRGALGRYEARLSQELEWAGQMGLRTRAAEFGSASTGGEVRDAARELIQGVEVAYAELIAARSRWTVAEDIRILNERLRNAVRVQLDEGEVSVLQANLVEIESGRARARVLEEERRVRTAEIELARIVGLPAGTEIEPMAPEDARPPEPEELSATDLLAAAVVRRPDLVAAEAAVAQSRALDRLATREALPNLRVQGIAEREAPGAPLRWGLGLSISLPLFDRNQGLRGRRDAELRASGLRHDGALLRVQADVRDALQGYRTAAEELRIYETSVLEPATRNQDLLEAAYAEGKLDLEALLLLRNQLLDAELGYWAAWARHREAWAALRSATGANLEDVTPVSNEEGSR